MIELYNLVKSTLLYSSAGAAVIGAMKIYEKWNRGESILPLLISWLFGTSIVTIIFYMVNIYIVSGGYNSLSPSGTAKEFATEIFETSLIIGVALAVFAVVSIYKKYTEGEDVNSLIFSWVGSILFLFFFGYIIEALLT